MALRTGLKAYAELRRVLHKPDTISNVDGKFIADHYSLSSAY